MKHILLITILGLFLTQGYAQENNSYEKFKTGIFAYEGRVGEVEICRTKKRQTEIYTNGKSKLILKIEWVNDSTYVLTHKKSKNAPGCLDKGDWIKAIIVASDNDTYTCSYTSNKCGEGKSVFIKLE
jgi:hypothetical protein